MKALWEGYVGRQVRRVSWNRFRLNAALVLPLLTFIVLSIAYDSPGGCLVLVILSAWPFFRMTQSFFCLGDPGRHSTIRRLKKSGTLFQVIREIDVTFQKGPKFCLGAVVVVPNWVAYEGKFTFAIKHITEVLIIPKSVQHSDMHHGTRFWSSYKRDHYVMLKGLLWRTLYLAHEEHTLWESPIESNRFFEFLSKYGRHS
jgi:hypothetical protein